MMHCRLGYRALAIEAVLFCVAAGVSLAQSASTADSHLLRSKHFDRVLIVVLENQNFESAMKNEVFVKLASKGAVFSNFGNLYHHSYPNYLAMIAGSDFGAHNRWNSDTQLDLKMTPSTGQLGIGSTGRTTPRTIQPHQPAQNLFSKAGKASTRENMCHF